MGHDDRIVHLSLDGLVPLFDAIAEFWISRGDFELLLELEQRGERIARRVERLDAKTPRQ